MKIHPFQCLYPNLNQVQSSDQFFASIKNKFAELKEEGFFIAEEAEALYLYKVSGESGHFRGIMVANDLEDVQNQKIKPHEKTLPVKEQLMLRFTLERQAMIKPLLLGYDTNQTLEEIFDQVEIEESFFSFVLENENELHTIWKIDNEILIAEIQNIFAQEVSSAYIADGHHRNSTATLIYNNPQIVQGVKHPIRTLTLYLPFKDLKIYDYNRIIKLKEGFSAVKLVVALAKLANIKPLKKGKKPLKKFEFCLFLDGDWYRCRWKKSVLNKYAAEEPILDVIIFNNELIEGILGLEDYELTYYLQFVPGTMPIPEFEKLTKESESSFGVLLHPVSIEELKSMANQHKVFPAKSTWFEPRVLNGVISLALY